MLLLELTPRGLPTGNCWSPPLPGIGHAIVVRFAGDVTPARLVAFVPVGFEDELLLFLLMYQYAAPTTISAHTHTGNGPSLPDNVCPNPSRGGMDHSCVDCVGY